MKTKTFPLMLVIAALAGCGSGDAMAPTMQSAQLSTGTLLDTDTPPEAAGTSSAFADPAVAADSGQFAIHMYQDGLGGIALAQAALQRATDQRVRRYAQQVLSDHARLNGDISALAATKGIPLPGALTPQQLADLNHLNALVPDALNIVYMSLNVAAHDAEAAAAMLQARRGGDPDLRLLASNVLPKLELRHAAAIEIENLLNPPVFLARAHAGNQFEVQAGQLALQKSSNAAVRQFAQQMIDAHTAAGTALAALAPNKGIGLPAELPVSMRAALDYLASFGGADFDKAYMDKLVVSHLLSLRRTQDMAERSHDADIRALGAQLLPTTDSHLAMAQQINDTLAPSYLYGAAQQANTLLRLARLTTEMGSNANLLAFAQQLTPDMAGAMPAIATLAQQRNLVLPVAASAGDLTAFAALMQSSGHDFDMQLVGYMLTTMGQIVTRESAQAQDSNDIALYDHAIASLIQSAQRQADLELLRQQLGGAVPE